MLQSNKEQEKFIWSGKRPSGMCLVGEMSIGEVSIREVSVGEMSVGKVSFGEVSGRANVRRGSVRTPFSEMSHLIFPWAKEAKNDLERGFILFFDKNSLDFHENSRERKVILLFLYQPRPHIWQNSCSCVIAKNALVQSDCRILLSMMSQERVKWYCWFFTSLKLQFQSFQLDAVGYTQSWPKST